VRSGHAGDGAAIRSSRQEGWTAVSTLNNPFFVALREGAQKAALSQACSSWLPTHKTKMPNKRIRSPIPSPNGWTTSL
jgi:ABC-type sugar transport system substrate-binding protein